ncbi:ATP-binding cassette domain-containing protein [Micromonospora olivasterospora]|uniref:ABC transporter domain-containing protein n=1 Tax=Micromonospora olivasterospora TaxID=1880 RepID=A0A562I2Q7_MICOL|nr:branched-chain amino acid ABC transporter permease/ATP-binding protein [Micromonospora olivasterospora]TWH65327.1 amino acid/amide ABC transporter membrane protein 1, HAAT family (TC 3.A.1.4.-)/amino acid/amide ABC transporter membrane protein 2, HAAT family (TC 3.A.1.4.-)/amino acid/amide ABC transporter ATP-binding protein 1, HAAT family (TC 3.A.1.4.-) [Micromonospora olivasterospora]
MSSLLPYIIAGITTGAVYGLAGSGLVITYKTSGIFNFAHGAIAAVAAYLFYWLWQVHGVPWPIAFALAVPVLGAVLGVVLELVGRHIVHRRVALQIVGTVGMILMVQALATLKFGPDPLRMDQYLPGGKSTFDLAGVNIGWDQLQVTCVAVLAAAALYTFFRRSRMGLAMRAVVDDDALVGLHGTNPNRVRRAAWIIGSTLASASGVLLAPMVGLESIALTYLVVSAIGAAAFGGFTSIPLTSVGGLVLGVVAALLQRWTIEVSWLSGLPISLPFIVLLVALMVTPKRKLGEARQTQQRIVVRTRAPGSVMAIMAVIVVGLLALAPRYAELELINYMHGLTLMIMLLSLGLLVRTSGQVSMCHAAFAGIGAFTFSQIVTQAGLGWAPAVLLGALVVVPVAALVALPAIRLRGLFLALATLAFGIAVERLVYPLDFAFGNDGVGRLMPRPSWAETDEAFYYLLLSITVATAVFMYLIDRGRLGRMLRGLSESPTAVQAMGLTTSSIKVLVFALSGFFAGLSGILYGTTVSYATYVDANYTSFHSLVLLVIFVIAPLGAPWYAIFGLPVAILPAYLHGEGLENWLNLLFGAFAVAVSLQGGAAPLPKRFSDLLARFAWSPQGRSVTLADLPSVPGAAPRPPGADGLDVRELRVHFGGLRAVDGVTISAPMGRVTGLIGPNGAGKTTMFNACSGLVRSTTGRVLLHGEDIGGLSAQRRARAGLGRTFQVTELCGSLTVRENVAMGREAAAAGWNPLSQMAVRVAPGERSVVAAATESALELCGIAALAEVPAGNLSTGERRLVEVARCLAGDFDVLMLDEPSAGLDHAESDRLRAVLERVVQERNCAILLVEHDMAFVMQVCDYLYVIDFGKPLFEGTPAEVAASAVVQAAYLGSSFAQHLPKADNCLVTGGTP